MTRLVIIRAKASNDAQQHEREWQLIIRGGKEGLRLSLNLRVDWLRIVGAILPFLLGLAIRLLLA